MKASAVLYVKHLDRMSTFYQRCFGMTTAESAAGYRILESEAWTLSLVVVPDVVSSAIDISTPPHRREDTPIKLAFDVANIEDLRPLVADLDGQIDPAETRWEFRGFRHCDGIDPEGNVIQLREPVAQQASTGVAVRDPNERATA